MIPNEVIDEVRARTDIVEVVSQYVELRRSGANLKGLCPFHEEKTPSFNVNTTMQIFRCFGCGAGGNVFGFLQKIENRTFPEVVEELAEKAGIEIPKEESAVARQARSEAENLHRANEKARELYIELYHAPAGASVREYVRTRGFTDDTVAEHGVGYCGPGWDPFTQLCKRRRHPLPVAEKAGLIVRGKRGDYYDRFHHRVVFPITNHRGRVIGFGGRQLESDRGPKYLNSAETPVYHKQDALYGLDIARPAIGRADRALIVEGYFDVLALSQAGFRETVATCGTALTAGHLRTLRRFTEKLVLVYDGDGAGRQAALRAAPQFVEAGMPVHVVLLPESDDPDTFLQKHGPDAMAELLDSAKSLERYFVMDAAKRRGRGEAERVACARQLAEVFRRAPDAVSRSSYAGLVADVLDLDPHLVADLFEGGSILPRGATSSAPNPRETGWKSRSDRGQGRPAPEPSAPLSEDEALRPLLDARRKPEIALVRLMLGSPGVAANVSRVGILESFTDHRLRALGEMILEVSEHGTHRVAVADLLARVEDEKSRGILDALSLDDDALFSENADQIFQDCVVRIRTRSLKERRRELESALAEATSAGDVALERDLLREVRALQRQEAEIKQA